MWLVLRLSKTVVTSTRPHPIIKQTTSVDALNTTALGRNDEQRVHCDCNLVSERALCSEFNVNTIVSRISNKMSV